MRAAQDSGDFSSFGELMAGKMAEAQQASAVNEAVGEGVNAELAETIGAVYGDTIKSLGPEGVAKLDAMPLADAIKALNEIQTRAAKPAPSSLAQEEVDRSRGRDAAMEDGFAEIGKAVREQIESDAG